MIDWLLNKLKHIKRQRALKKYGWDGKCYNCKLWHHAEANSKNVKSEPMYWHYECGNCGHVDKLFLGFPLPIHARDVKGLPEYIEPHKEG